MNSKIAIISLADLSKYVSVLRAQGFNRILYSTAYVDATTGNPATFTIQPGLVTCEVFLNNAVNAVNPTPDSVCRVNKTSQSSTYVLVVAS